MKRYLPAILLGLLAGFQGGLFGVGGGIVMVPGMVLFLAIPQHRAHATSLAAMIFSTSAAVIPLALDNRIDWDTAGFLVAGSMVGAYLGARLFSRIPEVWLAGGFVVLALASAVRMLIERDAVGARRHRDPHHRHLVGGDPRLRPHRLRGRGPGRAHGRRRRHRERARPW